MLYIGISYEICRKLKAGSFKSVSFLLHNYVAALLHYTHCTNKDLVEFFVNFTLGTGIYLALVLYLLHSLHDQANTNFHNY